MAIMLAWMTTQATTVEPSPQFRPVGQYPAALRPLLTEKVGEPDHCESAPVGAGKFVIRYNSEQNEHAGIYIVDVHHQSAVPLIRGRTEVLRLVQDKVDVSWMLIKTEGVQTGEEKEEAGRYVALVFKRPKKMMETSPPDSSPTPDGESVAMEISVATLVQERERRVVAYEITDLNGDGYPDARFELEDVNSRDRRWVSLVYTNGSFILEG